MLLGRSSGWGALLGCTGLWGPWGRQDMQTQGFAGEHIQVHPSGPSTGAEPAAVPILV